MSQVTNPVTGGEGGVPFNLTRNNVIVKQITVWIGPGSYLPNLTLIKGIRLTWEDNTSQTVAGDITGSTMYEFSFSNNDRVDSMGLYTGDRVDKIHFVTRNRYTFDRGGNGGLAHKQDVGNGALLGFWGFYVVGQELVSIGSIFQLDTL